MPHLTRDQRRQILDLLLRLPVLNTAAGRTQLLADLPPALVASLARSDTQRIDLAVILDGCAAWPPTAPPHPLQILLENAAGLVLGTQIASDLQAIWREIFI